ncbi:hypothetical protein [Pseudomonas veronii]|uniref:hypothetical protein n=1 Tax=Pseudomonas veronii TaxID=76761 RepID=UPI003988BF20
MPLSIWPDFSATAVEEIGLGPLAHIQYNQHGHQDNRQARDGRKRPGQLLLDIHDFSRGYL